MFVLKPFIFGLSKTSQQMSLWSLINIEKNLLSFLFILWNSEVFSLEQLFQLSLYFINVFRKRKNQGVKVSVLKVMCLLKIESGQKPRTCYCLSEVAF